MDRSSRREARSATNGSAGKYERRSIQEKRRVHHFRSSFAGSFVRSLDASNARSAEREKLLYSVESSLLACAARLTIRRQSIHDQAQHRIRRVRDEASTPSEETRAAKFPL